MADQYVAGVDGAPRGWVAVIGEVSRPASAWMVSADTLAGLVADHPRVRRWAIDMPLGLAAGGRRECDLLARQALGERRSSVFFAPPHSVAAGYPMSYRQACRVSESAIGKQLSMQTFNLLEKIQEARELVIGTPKLRSRILETHPELCFMRLASGAVLPSKKKTPEGRRDRLKLLNQEFGAGVLDRLTEQTAQTRGVNQDDTVDAAACWTAARNALQKALQRLPNKPPIDEDGLPVVISY